MKRKIVLLSLLVIAKLSYSQDTFIVQEDMSRTDIVYKIDTVTIHTYKYELKEVDNLKYLQKKSSIDSLKHLISELSLFKINKKTELENLLRTEEHELRYDKEKVYQEKFKKWMPIEPITRIISTVNADENMSPKLSGKFSPVVLNYFYGELYVITGDTLNFKKREIISLDSLQNYDSNYDQRDAQNMGVIICKEYSSMYPKSNNVYLIRDIESNIYYITFENFLFNHAVKDEMYALSKVIKKYNLKVSKGEDERYKVVEYKGKRCILTPSVVNELAKGNVSIITKMSNSVSKFKSYINKGEVLTVKIVKHIQAYQSTTLTSKRLEQWKKDTKQLGEYRQRINTLPYNTSPEYYKQLDSQMITKSSNNSDIYLQSSQLLGI